ncbi:MAG TPA: lysophospholipid acyltransferase family protein [Bacteroidota bacterium]|jgi:1-acyl-sn-glycerol-3-phosphate acyltransferase|nr:lysophospholipid acyltransferase family protein [Bacteroidota bacterium]
MPSVFKLVFALVFTTIISALIVICALFDHTGTSFHRLTKVFAHTLLRVCGVKITVAGVDKIPFDRSYVYVSNHASYFDIPAVIAAIPDRLHIVYKKELERIPIFGWGLKYGRTYIGIDRGRGLDAAQSLEDAATRIRNGASVLMFAEGTRSQNGMLQPFKRGPFNLAMKAGAPVVPVAIHGSYGVLPRNSWRIRTGTISLTLGEPITPMQANGRESEIALRDEAHSVIQRNLQQV